MTFSPKMHSVSLPGAASWFTLFDSGPRRQRFSKKRAGEQRQTLKRILGPGPMFVLLMAALLTNSLSVAESSQSEHFFFCKVRIYGYLGNGLDERTMNSRIIAAASSLAEKKVKQYLTEKLPASASFALAHDLAGNTFMIRDSSAISDPAPLGKNLTGLDVYGTIRVTFSGDVGSEILNPKLHCNQETYRPGDEMVLTLQSNRRYFGCIVDISPQGVITQILPNQISPDDNFPEGGFEYPDDSASQEASLVISPPYGNERIKLFASELPIGGILEENEPYSLFAQTDMAEEEISRKFHQRVFQSLQARHPKTSFAMQHFLETERTVSISPE